MDESKAGTRKVIVHLLLVWWRHYFDGEEVTGVQVASLMYGCGYFTLVSLETNSVVSLIHRGRRGCHQPRVKTVETV